MSAPRVRVKMCGMTRKVDVEQAISLGVDALGFIFYSKSRRCVTIDSAKTLLKNLPPFVDAVAVLVNPEKDEVNDIIRELPINVLQFHGDESLEFCQQFNVPFIKTLHPTSTRGLELDAHRYSAAGALLLDSATTEARGGTGLIFDWRLIPKNLPQPYIVAGGINELNVLEAVAISQPYAVDVCSGIEAEPGVKDPLKMNRFIRVLWG